MSSSLHEVWAWQRGSTLGANTLRYSPSDCFETFPFPRNARSLEYIGKIYQETRRQIMSSRWEGLTTTYNRFHDSTEISDGIATLRRLHVEMDQAVAAAYGWNDLDLGHGFHTTAQGVRYTISDTARRTVLNRLLALNHERYAEEVRLGLHDKKAKGKGKKKGAAEAPAEQMDLFDDNPPRQKGMF